MDIPVNDNTPHPRYFDMMTDFGNTPFMRIAARGVDRRAASNLWWFLRFERAMMEWEVERNRGKIEVVQ